MAKEGLGHYQGREHQAYSVLVLEDFPLITEHMQEMGHIVKTYSPRWLLSGSSSALPEITAGTYDLVWCSAPSRFFAGRHEFQILGRMAGIFRRANASHIAVVLSGTRNRLNHDALKALVNDKIAMHTNHDYCAYQTSLPADTTLPILGSQTILSNLTLTSRQCTCGTSEHYDIRVMHAGPARKNALTISRTNLPHTSCRKSRMR